MCRGLSKQQVKILECFVWYATTPYPWRHPSEVAKKLYHNPKYKYEYQFHLNSVERACKSLTRRGLLERDKRLFLSVRYKIYDT